MTEIVTSLWGILGGNLRKNLFVRMDFDKADVYILPVEQLKPNPWNPNEMSETAWQALGQSIVKHGIHLQPIVVRPRGDGYQIIDGEHRYKWAYEMGIKEVSAIVIDADDFTAKKLTQILNRTRGEDNPVQLKELLDSLLVDHSPDEVIEGMAIANEEELNHLLADLEREIMSDYGIPTNPDEAWGEVPEFDEEKEEPSTGTLLERFIVPPFSVLDARQGYWQERKRQWLSLGIQSELGRGGGDDLECKPRRKPNAAPGGSLMPSMTYSKDKARGNGKGQAIL